MKKIFILIVSLSVLNCSDDDKVKETNSFQKVALNTVQNITDIDFYDQFHGVVCGSYGFVSKTSDGGATWATLNTGINESLVCVELFTPSSIFTARGGVYHSNDAGQNFGEVGGLSAYSNSIYGLHFFDTNIGVVTKGNVILKTENGGADWQIKYEDAEYVDKLQFTSAAVGYVSGGITYDGGSTGVMHKTVDGGDSWSNLNLSTSQITAMHFLSDNVGYYYNFNQELFKTIDGGISWSKISQNEFDFVTSIIFMDESKGYLTDYAGGIYSTSNGGVTWGKIYTANQPLSKVIKTNDKLYVIGNEGLLLVKKI